MDWKNRFSQIANKVKVQLFAKKIENFSWVYKCIHDFDPQNQGNLSIHDFNLFLNKIGIFLSTQQLRTINDKFGYDNDARIYYVDFLNAIRGNVSEKLSETIKTAFQFLDYNKKGELDLEDLLRRYQAHYHPHTATRKKSPQEVAYEFETGLKLKSANQKTLTQKEFVEYYQDLNFCVPAEREEYFVDLILKTWGMTHGKEYVSAQRVQQIEDILYEKIRQKTEEKSSEGKAAKAAFKYFDLADQGECNLENFTRALDKFGCKFSPPEIQTLFSKYDTNSSGTISYDEFCQMFSAIGALGPSKIINPLTTLGKNSIGFNQLKVSY